VKILLAPDSFKESLSAQGVCSALRQGLSKILPNATYQELPLSDGGEGLIDIIAASLVTNRCSVLVHNPMGALIDAEYLWIPEGRVAIIEMAKASGLELVPKQDRDALRASTYGTGELIRDAIHRGAVKIVLGIGGSATTDGGSGALAALGFQFLNDQNAPLMQGGGALSTLKVIESKNAITTSQDFSFEIACDVDNPLLGPRGTAHIFAKQKGASPDDIAQLERNLSHFDKIIQQYSKKSLAHLPGAGAAGGLGYGLLSFYAGELKSGFDIVADLLNVRNAISNADIVITGEGEINLQTCFGKVPKKIAELASRTGKDLYAVCGKTGEGFEQFLESGVKDIVTLFHPPLDLEYCIDNAETLLVDAGEQLGKLIKGRI